MIALNNIKDPISDLIGILVIAVTMVMLYQEKIVWQWEGMIGVGVGCFLFFVPDQIIVDSLLSVLKKLLSLIGIKNG
jgi:hypothetical protein